MQKPRLGADRFGEIGQEGDNVVLRLFLDVVDPGDIEGELAAFSQIALAASFGMMPISASASQACASISNQMRNRVCGSQRAAISGRE